MKVVHLPCYDENPYQGLLMAAQRELGWEVIDGGGGGNFIGVALRQWKPEVMHFHWLHPYLLRDSWFGSFLRSSRFLLKVLLLKLRGTRIAWTIHNLANHDGRHAGLERFFTMLFAQMVDLPVAHSHEAASLASKEFRIPEERILVAPHPGYCGYYTDTVTRADARRRFGYEEGDRVFLFLGRIQPYKGIFDLLEAFRDLPEHCRLLIAGSPADEKTAERLLEAAAADPRIQFHPGHAGRDEVQWFYRAADVVVFPFRKILTSGSVMLAMSFGKPLILPEGATMRETVGDGEALWFHPGSIDSLNDAMILADGQLMPTGSRNSTLAAALTWQVMAKSLIERYSVTRPC
jgi:glycosyltransferase involved in cell wall biosynthesis